MHFYPHFYAFCNVKLANDHTFPLYFGIKDNIQPHTSHYSTSARNTIYERATYPRHIHLHTYSHAYKEENTKRRK